MTSASDEQMVVVERESMLLVGIEVRASWESLWIEMPAAWRDFMARAAAIHGVRPGGFLDVSIGVEDGEYTQFIGAHVDRANVVPAGMTTLQIPAQRYLHFVHVGEDREIASSFGRMYEYGLREGLRLDEFKIDRGYGTGDVHELLVRVVS